MPKRRFVCQECGYQSFKWLGRCPSCGKWASLVEEEPASPNRSRSRASAQAITEISQEKEFRLSTGLAELDQVLGGGIVPGSLVLIGGDPGIGKSTLLLQVLKNLASAGQKVLYLTGEESPQQIKLRAERLGAESPQLFVLGETDLEAALETAQELSPVLLVVDSIQTVFWPELSSAPGSVAQVRECTAKVLEFAKKRGIAVFIVGHVTKEGLLAGPRVLEHLVDTVLYFEGERGANFRILRAVKNRFGPTNEIGVFEMSSTGLIPVTNPSALFLSQLTLHEPGSVVLATLEGTRPILVEVQALVANTPLAMPRRTSVGFDPQRLAMLAAILEKRLGLTFYDRDIYLNVAGGLKLTEPGADLAVALALISSYLEKPLPSGLFVFGEVGLSGEIRAVAQQEARLKEGQRLEFEMACLPKTTPRPPETEKLKLFALSHLQEALDLFFR